MYRKPKKNELVGKTIKRVDVSSDNMLIIYFTDGSNIRLEAESSSLNGSYAICVWDENSVKVRNQKSISTGMYDAYNEEEK